MMVMDHAHFIPSPCSVPFRLSVLPVVYKLIQTIRPVYFQRFICNCVFQICLFELLAPLPLLTHIFGFNIVLDPKQTSSASRLVHILSEYHNLL